MDQSSSLLCDFVVRIMLGIRVGRSVGRRVTFTANIVPNRSSSSISLMVSLGGGTVPVFICCGLVVSLFLVLNFPAVARDIHGGAGTLYPLLPTCHKKLLGLAFSSLLAPTLPLMLSYDSRCRRPRGAYDVSFAADELFAALLKRLEDPKELLMVDALVAAPRVHGGYGDGVVDCADDDAGSWTEEAATTVVGAEDIIDMT